MSVKLMAAAFDKTDLNTTQKMVLLVLCDHADDDGGSCRPSVARVAQKAALSTRQCQRVMKHLEALGYFKVIANEYGGRNMARHLQLNVQKITSTEPQKGDTSDTLNRAEKQQKGDAGDRGDILTPLQKGDTGDAERVTPVTQKGDTGDAKGCHGCHPTHQEPSRTTSEPSDIHLPAICKIPIPPDVDVDEFMDWLEVRKLAKKPLTPTAWKGILRESEKAGKTPREVVGICSSNGWIGFKAHWLSEADGGKWDSLVTDVFAGDVIEVDARRLA